MGPHCCSVLHVMHFLALVFCILLYALNQAEIPSWSEAAVMLRPLLNKKFKADGNRRWMWKIVL